MTLIARCLACTRAVPAAAFVTIWMSAAVTVYADVAGQDTTPSERFVSVPTRDTGTEFETPGTLHAPDLIPGYLLSGELFRVDQAVRNDGETNHYVVQSPDGALEAVGRDGLVKVIQEIRALDLLRDSRKRDGAVVGFNQGMKRFAGAPYRSVKRVVFDPLYAVEAVPGEIADYAGKLATVGDLFHYGPYVFVRRSLGIDGARSDLARRLHVDSNTDNEALASEIKRVGWGVWMGGIVPSVGDNYVDLQLDLSKEVGDLGDGNLGRAVDAIRREVFPRSARRMFKKMDIPTELSKSVRSNEHYTDRMRENFATALMTLDETEGRIDFVAWADTVESALEARQVVRIAQVLAVFNALEEPIESIHGRDDVLAVRTGESGLIALLRSDYLLWTESAAHYVAQVDALKQELLHDAELAWWSSGDVSPRLREVLIARGDTIRINVDDDFPAFERPRRGLERLEQKYERRVEDPLKEEVEERLPEREPRLRLAPVGPNQASPSG